MMMKKTVFGLLLTACLIGGTGGCKFDNLAELQPFVCDPNATVSFSDDIKPILSSTCGTGNSCHGSNNTSGVPLNSYAGVKTQADSGKLLSSVTWDGNASFMPQSSIEMIDSCLIGKFSRWIAAGAPNN